MKTIAKIMAALLPAVTLAPGCRGGSDAIHPPAATAALMRFHFDEHGTMAQPNFEYALDRDSSGRVSLYVFKLFDDSWGDTLPVGREVIDHVQQTISDNKLHRYKESYRPRMQVLDGYMWSYEAVYDDGTRLHSHGSNARPNDDTLPTIAAYLDSCYQAALHKK